MDREGGRYRAGGRPVSPLVGRRHCESRVSLCECRAPTEYERPVSLFDRRQAKRLPQKRQETREIRTCCKEVCTTPAEGWAVVSHCGTASVGQILRVYGRDERQACRAHRRPVRCIGHVMRKRPVILRSRAGRGDMTGGCERRGLYRYLSGRISMGHSSSLCGLGTQRLSGEKRRRRFVDGCVQPGISKRNRPEEGDVCGRVGQSCGARPRLGEVNGRSGLVDTTWAGFSSQTPRCAR